MINFKFNALLVVFSICIFLFSCNSKPTNFAYAGSSASETQKFHPPEVKGKEIGIAPMEMAKDEDIEPDESILEPTDTKTTEGQKKIIKDGSITVKTNDINASKKGIDNLIKNLNAYYESEDLQKIDQGISYNIKIRIPADNFEKLVSSIENGKDEIISKNIQARDVTEEYLDIETRLANKRQYLKRYRELLARASTVKDVLAIEENIRTIQEEIESKEGRLKYLNDQVAFSTLNIILYNESDFIYKPESRGKFFERVKKSLHNGWISIVDFILWLLSIWPVILLVFLGLYFGRKFYKNKFRS